MEIDFAHLLEVYGTLEPAHVIGLVALAVLAYSAFILFLLFSRRPK